MLPIHDDFSDKEKLRAFLKQELNSPSLNNSGAGWGNSAKKHDYKTKSANINIDNIETLKKFLSKSF